MTMKKNTYSVSQFKAESLGLLEKITKTGESIIVTKRGKPIAKVVPIAEPGFDKPILGKLKGTIVSEIDIITPLGSQLWKATK